jgi:prevent-host-death family protein
MVAMGISEFRKELPELVNRVSYKGERIAIQRHGRKLVVLISAEEYETYQQLMDKMDAEEAERILADPAQKPIPFVPKHTK